MDFGRMVRGARHTARLTQSALAARAGTSQATLSAYETGAKVPSAATLERLLAACGHRLVAEPGRHAVRTPSAIELERRGATLAQVIDLAERLPRRHSKTIEFPPLVDVAAKR